MSDGRATLSWPRGPAVLRALTLTAPDGKGVVGQGQSGGPGTGDKRGGRPVRHPPDLADSVCRL